MSRLGLALRLLVVAVFLAVALPLQWLAVRGGRGARRLPVRFHRLVLALFGVRVEVRGRPPAGAALVLANHVSWLDIVVMGSLTPLSFIAKSEIAGWPVIGTFARLQRTVFIERARRSHTAEVNAAVARRLAEGDLVVLFAEGTTGDGNRLLPFRSSLVGAARAAVSQDPEARILLQPLAVAYTRRGGLPVTRRERPAIAWYGDMALAPHLAAFVREGPLDAVVTWGEPVPFDAATDRKLATQAAEAAVRQALSAARGGVAPAALEAPASRTAEAGALALRRSAA